VCVALCGCGLSMSQELADNFQADSTGDQVRRIGVPQVVKADPLEIRLSADFGHGYFRSVKCSDNRPGNRYSPSLGSVFRNATAASLSGTYSMRFCFVAWLGLVHTPRSKSNWSHIACRTSPLRAPVKTSNRIALTDRCASERTNPACFADTVACPARRSGYFSIASESRAISSSVSHRSRFSS